MSGTRKAEAPLSTRIIPAVVAGALALLVTGSAWALWPAESDETTTVAEDTAGSSEESTGTEDAVAVNDDGEGSGEGDSVSTGSESGDDDALGRCRSVVDAADEVVEAGRIAGQHWNTHVTSQYRRNAGKISEATMKKNFARTREAGPDDMKRWGSATATLESASGTCQAGDEMTQEAVATLEQCQARREAQDRMIDLTRPVVADWNAHLEDMAASAAGTVDDPMAAWVKAYRAAGSNLDPWNKARKNYDPPVCEA